MTTIGCWSSWILAEESSPTCEVVTNTPQSLLRRREIRRAVVATPHPFPGLKHFASRLKSSGILQPGGLTYILPNASRPESLTGRVASTVMSSETDIFQ